MRRAAAPLAALLALAGCSSLIPPLRAAGRAGARRPIRPRRRRRRAPSAEAAADIDWQRFFADPRLKQLIGLALANNRDLRVAVLNIEQTRALYQVRRADELPTVGVGATVHAPTPIGNLGRQRVCRRPGDHRLRARPVRPRPRPERGGAGAVLRDRGDAQGGADQPDLVGRERLPERCSPTTSCCASPGRRSATREESTRLTKLRFDNGASSELDYRQAESLLESARATLAQSLRQRALDENALVLLVGQALPADLPRAAPARPAADPGRPAGRACPPTCSRAAPTCAPREQQLLAANANIGAARAAFFPHITLTGNLGSASTRALGPVQERHVRLHRHRPAAAADLRCRPQPGQPRRGASVNRDIAVAQYEKSIQTAFREVADALAGRATLGEQLRAQAAQTNALAITYRLADLRYRAGAASYLDILDAQRSLFASQQALVQTQALQLQNLVTLYRALGGGWHESAEVAAPSNPHHPAAALTRVATRARPARPAPARSNSAPRFSFHAGDRCGHLGGVEDRALQQRHLLQRRARSSGRARG